MNKKKNIDKLNEMLNNYQMLCHLCHLLSNDVNKVIEKISKIIKYVLINKDFYLQDENFHTILDSLEDINIDYEYQKYLKSSINLFPIKKTNNILSINLDDDIRISDLKNLRLPSEEDIQEACNDNIRLKKLEEESTKISSIYYKQQKGFEETSFLYKRVELITINSNFIYKSNSLSGKKEKDFDIVYNDDRDKNVLNNSFYSNIESIKREMNENKMIKLIKVGNVYEIVDGRHRILYILNSGIETTIPANVSKRFEDREVNVLLDYLIENNVLIYKNNILNDELNILLVKNNKMYEITSKEDLINFCNKLKNNNNLEEFSNIDFKIIPKEFEKEYIKLYTNIIYKKYLELGDSILTGNFTNVIKYFDNVNNNSFYQSFKKAQEAYQKAKVFDYDFKSVCQQFLNLSNENLEKEVNNKKR